MTLAALVLALIATPNAETGRDPVILDFHAAWCGPCQQMRPAVELLIQKGYPVKSVDIERARSLAQRYHVSSVPTFIVVDAEGHELDRTQGLQPASRLASLYRQAKTKAARPDPATTGPQTNAEDEPRPADTSDASDADQAELETKRPAPLPKPWQTVVRICVHNNGILGYGSGTIIHSTADETLILTCAHIFKLDGMHAQSPPARFPHKITVDLFDGKLQGLRPAMVHRVATVAGEAIDYDFSRDVGLIRIRPGRRLPAARVVPPTWRPEPKMEMVTVGCSEGNDATAWTTWIVNPHSTLRVSGRPYEAIECVHAPKLGRSGGGLYTPDGYVAGVCDFAEPVGNRGLYASPQSIYKLLDRNRLMALYDPGSSRPKTLLADNQPKPKPVPARTLRAQSPDRNETKQVTLPAPELLGIKTPAVAATSARTDPKGKSAWRHSTDQAAAPNQSLAQTLAARTEEPAGAERADDGPIPVEIKMAPSVEDDVFTPSSTPTDRATVPIPSATKPSAPSRWRAVRTDPAN